MDTQASATLSDMVEIVTEEETSEEISMTEEIQQIDEVNATKIVVDEIPEADLQPVDTEGGTIEEISYTTKDYFGAFSAAPTTYDSTKIADCLKNFEEYDIHYYYGVCGNNDGMALRSAMAAVNGLTEKTDKLIDGENFTWQLIPGGHDFNIWYLGYYNFAQLVFK